MSKQPRKIKLSQIRLETSYRKSEKDLSLELSINRQGLKVPLVVEEEGKNQYVLVDGYRRFYALEFLEIEDAECNVEKLSSEEERIVKRLGIELHTKKRTAYQLERMINRLLENKNYDARLIASLCDVNEETVNKYIRGSEVNPEWLRRGEKAGAGRHAFTDIHKLNLSEETKNYIADKYIDRQINKSTVDIIKKATNENAFKDIPEEDTKECIDQIIEQHTKNYETVKEFVCESSLRAGYSKSSHTFMHNLTLNLLSRIEKIFNNGYYVNYLSTQQKAKMTKLLQNLLQTLNPPIKWSDFPKNEQAHESIENEDGESLEH
ncbi:ParB/RepB/Spo0J family partition protein [Rossellomorea vietnamensis]|uniref:ParB/RepB/Spo0J family partition protein n=1 Tax=Rossellomorea vietnamensis TaxID=218284 RepID=A0A5D4NVM1_9BACI|nr:ParB/RepB/Spo0J family partition protein [Rossellomorea vietnamensis]TYS17721.1 ParB/RepB/Spo0J family partition protein [Rossellomorea vietnamensis]